MCPVVSGARRGRPAGQERLSGVVEKLKDELEKQTKHVAAVQKRLEVEKDGWLLNYLDGKRPETMMQLLQTCILPRVMFT